MYGHPPVEHSGAERRLGHVAAEIAAAHGRRATWAIDRVGRCYVGKVRARRTSKAARRGLTAQRTRVPVASTGGREHASRHTDIRTPFPPTFLLVRFLNARRQQRARDSPRLFSLSLDFLTAERSVRSRAFLEALPLLGERKAICVSFWREM